MNCHVNLTMHKLEFQIVDKPVVSLLGLEDSLKMNLIKLNERVHEVQTDGNFRKQILEKHKDLFDDNLGKLPIVYSMKVNSDVPQ